MHDKNDIHIIQKLLQDAKQSHDRISEDLNLSRSAIHRRINRLQNLGVINRFSIEIDWQKLGYTVDTFILIVVNTKDFRRLQQELISVRSEGIVIEECYRITSKYGFMMRVKAKNLGNLTNLYDELLKNEDVQETNTLFILTEKRVDIDFSPLLEEQEK